MTYERESGRGHPGPRRLLSLSGSAVIAVMVLAHLLGGAALAQAGIPSALGALGPGALIVGLAAVVAVKLAVVFGARRWLRHH